jgi:IS5 family transposase
VGRRKKKLSRSLRKWFKRRAAIEPIIGHIKSDHRMNRNHYQGQVGDAVNATLSATGFNLRKLLAFFLRWILGRFFALQFADYRTIGTKTALTMA